MPCVRVSTTALLMFQSAPAIAGGRCRRTPGRGQRMAGFNPRPPLLAGDAFMPAPPRACRHGFNPRPPLLAGDARQLCPQLVGQPVSIRARHCWRAMPQHGADGADHAGFQSAPAIAGGRCTVTVTIAIPGFRFQSAPAIAGGRCRARNAESIEPEPVSIRARHCWRAMLGRRGGTCASARVSIRARHCWRAMPVGPKHARQVVEFQSAPAIAGGRCGRWPTSAAGTWRFNPRPPLLAGDASTWAPPPT